jgi:mannose-6-phosphate isomerase-like protein (cupin superfamily)
MKHVELPKEQGFKVIADTKRSQAASMVIAPGDHVGGPDNFHSGSDQWLYVCSGHGRATVNDRDVELTQGTLLLIEAGDCHEIRNPGSEPLVTINVYAPPEY